MSRFSILLIFASSYLFTQNNNCNARFQNNTVKCISSSFSEYFSPLGGLNCYFDFDEGLECSNISQKPCIVYFNKHNCIECRKVEYDLFSNSETLNLLQNNFIFIDLNTDDKMELSPFYQVISIISGDTIKKYGERNIYYQKRIFNDTINPAFYIIDQNLIELTNSLTENITSESFNRFLKSGLENFKQNEDCILEDSEFLLRVHTSKDKIDNFQNRGFIQCDDFISLYDSINWKSDFKREFESKNFNFTDIEVLNKKSSFYLSISVAPYKNDSIQHIIGFGYHQKRIEQVNRMISLYGTRTINRKEIIKIIKLFFNNDIDKLTEILDNYEFIIELYDDYNNY